MVHPIPSAYNVYSDTFQIQRTKHRSEVQTEQWKSRLLRYRMTNIDILKKRGKFIARQESH